MSTAPRTPPPVRCSCGCDLAGVIIGRPCPGCGRPVTRATLSGEGGGDATGGIIPYKNGPALAAYYTGIGALIPCLIPFFVGAVAGGVALYLGVLGLKKVKAQPEVKGTVHAWIGIVLGALIVLANLAMSIAVVVAMVRK